MRLQVWLIALLLLVAAGCGGSSGESGGTADGDSLESVWKRPGEDVAVIPGTSDYAPGDVRVSFLVVAGDGKVVQRPRARVWLAPSRTAAPIQQTEARLEPVGAEGSEAVAGDVRYLFVTTLRVPRAGTWWYVAEPVGGYRIQALGQLQVRPSAFSPAIGAKAPASETPTLASTGGDLAELSTATEPEPKLHERSIAQALEAKEPFVVAFATPKFCASRACGPVVDVVDDMRKEFAPRGVRFIHVEVFTDNDPTKGVNRWMKEWNLQTEPWVFVVGADGKIAAKFEGSASADESCGRGDRAGRSARLALRARAEVLPSRRARGPRADAPVLVGARREPQLLEDPAHVLLDGALGDDEGPGDAGVRAALGHQPEHLALARREPVVRARSGRGAVARPQGRAPSRPRARGGAPRRTRRRR